jgi:hypothetical protein
VVFTSGACRRKPFTCNQRRRVVRLSSPWNQQLEVGLREGNGFERICCDEPPEMESDREFYAGLSRAGLKTPLPNLAIPASKFENASVTV